MTYSRKLMRAIAVAVFGVSMIGAAYAEAARPALTTAQEKTVDDLIDRALEDDLAWDVLESLTTEIGPRLAGSDQETRAREWGAAKLKSLGFNNVRIETFELPYWERRKEVGAIVSPYPQPLALTALGNSVSTPEGGVEAEVVRFASLADLQDAPMTGLEGKIVFVDEPMTRTMDGSGYGPAVAKRSGAANEAGKRGAVVAIIRSVGTDSHRMPHTGGMRYAEGVAKKPIAALSIPDADQLARAIEIANSTGAGPVKVSLDIQTTARNRAVSGNVIGEIPGQTDELIVIGGHLDSWDLGTGAVDDGAGVAITVAAAKLIDALRGKPKRTIRVVMWGSEEVGLYGARAYANAHADELDRHVLASESDFGAGRVWQFQTRFGETSLPKGAVMARHMARIGVNLGDNKAFGGPDATPLRLAGVPVVSLRQDGTDYFDLHHTPDDTLDKVDPEALRQNVAAWAAMVYMASEMTGGFRE